MKRLLTIEWLKLKHYRPFWVLTGLYALLIALICFGVRYLFEFIKSKGGEIEGFDPTMFPFYDFPDIWQNITYIATFLKLFLAFLIIISISNEVNYRTLRQNIIDGMSKKGWIASKLLLIGSLALAASLLLFVIGVVSGLMYSHPDGIPFMLNSTQFLFAYFLEVFTFLTFAMLISLIIRRPGIVIVGLMMYTLAFEPLLATLLTYPPNEFHFPEWTGTFASFFPIRALNNLIHAPFQKWVLIYEIQDYVSLKEVSIVLGWLVFNVSMCYWILKKRDL